MKYLTLAMLLERDWADWVLWVLNVLLVIVGLCGIAFAYRTLKTIEAQTKATEDAAIATGLAARAALLNAQAMINSERAYIDGEIIKHEKIGVTRYSINMKNHGRTPAQIFSSEISYGLLAKGTEYSGEKLSTQIHSDDYVFLASGDSKTLRKEFDMDEYLATSEPMRIGAFRVTIIYGDVVSGGKGQPERHETSFVYRYDTFLSSLERISASDYYT